ncbi:MAG: UPF0147 family protein [Candidatus Hodarchaeaceae archaeon]|nr:UPF0147 family protein [Candidatus Hodarchaeaceae archaeon]MDI6883854.1 UPF0147 family protein [Hadesarchaea archaeon]
MSSDAKLKQVADIMARVADDTSVPRNIRRAAGEAREALLKGTGDSVVKAASARITLEEISNDPNMPVHTRTMIWNALSILETIRE